MRTSLFCSLVDVADVGAEQVLDDVCGRAGLDRVTIATAYHAVRDLLPHARTGRVRSIEAGLWIPLDPDLWKQSGLQPQVAGDETTDKALADLLERSRAAERQVDGWTVFLHADRAGLDDGLGAERNVFGDCYPEQLCPADPLTQTYATTLARAVVRSGMPTVVAESLHFHGLEHGVHHERLLFDPGPVGRFLLGLCMCQHCLAAGARAGIDVERFTADVRRILQTAFDSGQQVVGSVETLEQASQLCGGEMGRWIRARQDTVTKLVERVAVACREESGQLILLDMSGAAKGYADGLPTGLSAAAEAWRLGLDLEAIAAFCSIEAIAYAHDPVRVALDLDAYRQRLPGDTLCGAILRPFGTDCSDLQNLTAKVELCRQAGLERLDFYHYGLMPLPTLDRIRLSLE